VRPASSLTHSLFNRWDDAEVPPALKGRIPREFERLQLVVRQIRIWRLDCQNRLAHPPHVEVRHPPNSFGSLRGMPAVVTRAHAAGAGTIRVHQAAADINSSSVLLGFSFEREHRPDWRMAFGIRPFPCEIGPNAQDEMDMVAHDGITADIDREDSSKLLEPLADPLLVVLVIMSGFDVEPTKERPANASRDAMIDPNLVGRHDLRARASWHRDVTPFGRNTIRRPIKYAHDQ
jgi:hypothetical protein